MPILYIFSGLPGAGKTTLAKRLAGRHNATYLRIDTIEQALRDLCDIHVEGEGYRMAYRLAAENLNLGSDVVADSCNAIELTRQEWEQVAIDNNSTFVNIEVTCKDSAEHRHRIETRSPDIAGHQLPDWSAVTNRYYDKWKKDRVMVDTSSKSLDDAFHCLERLISQNNAG